jgi:small subunit ribosomal protein S6
MVHEYEIVYIIRPDLDDADTNALIERIEGSVTETGGTLIDKEDWGKRKLAYPILKHQKGHYVLLRVASAADQILEIERRLRLDDRVIRFITVFVAETVDIELRKQQAVERRARAAEEAKRRAAETELDDSRYDDDEDDGGYDASLD